jgi:hypothetical protein
MCSKALSDPCRVVLFLLLNSSTTPAQCDLNDLSLSERGVGNFIKLMSSDDDKKNKETSEPVKK